MKQLTITSELNKGVWVTSSEVVTTVGVTVASGHVIKARTLISQDSTTGLYVPWAHDGLNGTNEALYITAYDVDTSASSDSCTVYKSGCFNPDLIEWPENTTDLQKSKVLSGKTLSLQKPQQ